MSIEKDLSPVEPTTVGPEAGTPGFIAEQVSETTTFTAVEQFGAENIGGEGGTPGAQGS